MIVDIVLLFASGRGGVEEVLKKVSKGLQAKGHRIRIFSAYQAYFREWEEEVDELYYYASTKEMWKEDVFDLALDYQKYLRSLGRPDIILATHMPLLSAICKAATAFMGEEAPPILSWIHGEIECYGGGDLLEFSEAHLAISKNLGKTIKEQIKAKAPVYCVGNPVCTNQEELVKQVKEGLQLVYIGRLENKQKRLDVLFKALARLNCPYHLKIVGEGVHEQWLRQLGVELNIVEHIEWLGWQSNPWENIKEATALIISSDKEGFGLVLVEALQRGIPVIATACVGPEDIIEQGKNGWLYPVGDSYSLGNILMQIAQGKLALPDAQTCRQSVERFQVDKVVERIEEVLLQFYYKDRCKKECL